MRHWMSLREVAGSAWKKLKIMQNWDEEVGVMCLDTSLYEWRNGAQLGNRELCSQSLYGGKILHMSTTLNVSPCESKRFTEQTVTFLCTIFFSCVHNPVTTYHTAGSLPPQRHIFNGQMMLMFLSIAYHAECSWLWKCFPGDQSSFMSF